jgi:hypothetical protein
VQSAIQEIINKITLEMIEQSYIHFTAAVRDRLVAEGYDSLLIHGIKTVRMNDGNIQSAIVLLPLTAARIASFTGKWIERLYSLETDALLAATAAIPVLLSVPTVDNLTE